MTMKFRNAAEMKWFVYLSKSKLSMLFGQIAQANRDKRSLEWKITTLVASVTRKTEVQDDVDEHDMLKAVLTELEASGQVGSIYEPKIYIKGTLPMRWGMYDDSNTRPDGEPALVYFGSIDTQQQVLLGLGGSSKHVMGYECMTSTYSRSATPPLVKALLRGLEYPIPESPEWYKSEFREDDEIVRAMTIAQHYLRPPTQNMEFFAKVLMEGEAHNEAHYIGIERVHVILATPLYVAMAAPYPKDDHWGLIPE